MNRNTMLEQLVIDRLNPLKGERLIILADPQRIIRAGAQAVDGWATENVFTVLFCSGNQAMRESAQDMVSGLAELANPNFCWAVNSSWPTTPNGRVEPFAARSSLYSRVARGP
jgi:hypothetical protein